jgi:hypothetical protein
MCPKKKLKKSAQRENDKFLVSRKIEENFSPKFNYKQNINLFWIRFVGMDLKCTTLDVITF